MIQNLLFDLGGVIMDIKRDNCVEAFRLLGLPDPNAFFGEYGQKGPFMQLEEGTIGTDEFHAEVRKLLPASLKATDSEIDDAFMKFLVGIPDHRLTELQMLRQNYGIYMLSNTNPIMWNAKIADEFRKQGLCIDDYFDGIVTSFEAKAMKPSRAIFDYAVEHLRIKPEQTLFFDDSQANVDAAIALGFRGAHVKPGREFMDVINELNLA